MVRSNRLSQRSLLATMALCMVLLSLQLTSPTSAAAPKSSQTPSHSAISGPEAVARAKTWVDAKVPYNQHAFNSDGYREDCVGLVSMAWGVPAPGMGNTISVLKNYVTQISPNDLQPGDALLNAYGGARPADWQHIILFAGWVNQNNHSAGYNGYEESPYYNGAHYSTNVPFPYYGGFDTNDYIAVRYNNIVDKNQPAFYANKIVQWKDPAKTQLIAWLVTPDLKRLWIPDSATFYCLTGEGVEVAGVLSSTLLDKLPDQTGRSVLCGSMQPVAAKLTPTPTTTPLQPTPTTAPPPPSTPSPTTAPPPPTVTPTPQPQPVNAYDNYGQANLWGHSMCRGNPANSLSMPGGTGTQTFTVPAGVATISSAKIQIDPASVTAQLQVAVNGVVEATTSAAAVGDTYFSFGPVSVHAGDTVELIITFSATYGKIITLYTVGYGVPGGVFTSRNTCPDGASNDTVTNGALRAVVYGMS